MTKDKIRCTMRNLNRSIGLGERTHEAHNIFTHIEIDQNFIDATCIALYVALPDEVPTLNIIDRWHKMGKRLVLPRVIGQEMEFVEYSPDSLIIGAFGILEPSGEVIVAPSQIELMILPGVAFCQDGRRLGRGRGYYDKYLSLPNFSAYTIGVGFAHQLLDEIPCELHDVKLSKVITPRLSDQTPTLPEVIVKIIDAAGAAAVGLGCGVDRLISMGMTWVLSRLSVEIYKLPTSIDDILIETWIEECSRIASTRNFLITNLAGERIGMATSQWCIIDMKVRRPIDLTASEVDYTRYVEPRKFKIDRPRNIPQFDGDQTITSYHTANELDIDFNNHVNTMRYIEMMLAMVDQRRSTDYAGSRIDLHFIHESLLGDSLTIKQREQSTPNGTQLLFEIIRPDDTTSVRALFDYTL